MYSSNDRIYQYFHYVNLEHNGTSADDYDIYYIENGYYSFSIGSGTPNLHTTVWGSIKVKYNGTDHYPIINQHPGGGVIDLSPEIINNNYAALDFKDIIVDCTWRHMFR